MVLGELSARSQVPQFHAMGVLAEANRLAALGRDIVHMEVGEPDARAPARVREAATAAIEAGRTGYTEALGLPELRRAIASHYRDFYGVEIETGRVIVTTGASGAFILVFLALFNPGDRVALASPGYPAYRSILTALGIDVVSVPGLHESAYQPVVDLLRPVADDLQGVVLASPANPTGSVMPEAELRRLVAFCRERNIRLVADEIYHGITYERACPTVLGIDDQSVVVNSFSKYFAMTGWRLGWVVGPAELIAAAERLAMNFFLCAPTVAQVGACEVFNCYAELDSHVERYRANRDSLLDGLSRSGFDRVAAADGAFYLYVDVSDFTDDSFEFARQLLHNQGIAVAPGVDFDRDRGHRFVRLSYAGAPETIQSTVDRLSTWTPRHTAGQ